MHRSILNLAFGSWLQAPGITWPSVQSLGAGILSEPHMLMNTFPPPFSVVLTTNLGIMATSEPTHFCKMQVRSIHSSTYPGSGTISSPSRSLSLPSTMSSASVALSRSCSNICANMWLTGGCAYAAVLRVMAHADVEMRIDELRQELPASLEATQRWQDHCLPRTLATSGSTLPTTAAS